MISPLRPFSPLLRRWVGAWGGCKPNVFDIELLVRSKSLEFGFVYRKVVYCFQVEAFASPDLARGSGRPFRFLEANLEGSLFCRLREFAGRDVNPLVGARRRGRGMRSSGSRGSVGYLGCNRAYFALGKRWTASSSNPRKLRGWRKAFVVGLIFEDEERGRCWALVEGGSLEDKD